MNTVSGFVGANPKDVLEGSKQTALGYAEGATGGILRGIAQKVTGQDLSYLRGNMAGRIAGTTLGIPGIVFKAVSGAKLLKGKPLMNLMISSGAAGLASSPETSNDPFDISARLRQGIASAILSKPLEMGAQAIASGATGIANAARRAFPLTQSAKLFAMREAKKEAETLTAQILQPKEKEFSDSIARGFKLPAIREGAKNIVNVKNFDELIDVYNGVISKTMNQRNTLLIRHNKPIDINSILDDVSNFIEKAKTYKIYSSQQIRKMGNVASQELDFISQYPDFDIAMAQARKETLQDATKPLLAKRSAGTLSPLENAEMVMRDVIRSSYRKTILKTIPNARDRMIVDRANSQYEGLLEGRDLASNVAARVKKEMPKTLLEKIATSFGLSLKYTGARLALKSIAGIGGRTHLDRVTGKIENLRTQADVLKDLIRAARKKS